MDLQKVFPFAVLALASVWGSAHAGELDVTGFFGLSNRSFWQDPPLPAQAGGSHTSMQLQSEIYWRGGGGGRASVVAFGRYDADDDERSHADLREAYWGYRGESWDLSVGINKMFWGVAESRHLVDVVNQTDLVEDIDQEDKLGQTMLNINVQRDFGRFELYLMPRFRERTFPGGDGRLRTPLPVHADGAIYQSPAGDDHNDVALRYSHYFGDVDIGAYVFDGTSREPSFVIAPEGDRLLPFYEQMTQLGVDVQYTRNSWLWKLEAIARDTTSDTFAAAVGGFEYTFFGARGTGADVGLLFEYLYDNRDADAPPTAFDNDVFIGTRLALNNSTDTSLLAGAVVDAHTHETFLNIEAERRFGDNLTVDLRVRAFTNIDNGDALSSIAEDDYLQLTVNWYY